MAACQEPAIYNFMLNHARTLEIENAQLRQIGELMAAHLEHVANFPPPQICGRHTAPWKQAAAAFRELSNLEIARQQTK